MSEKLNSVIAVLTPAADITPQMLTPLGAMSRLHAPQQIATLFDHLVGAGDESERNVQADSGGGLQIDDQLEFGGQLDRQVGGPRPFENAVHIARRALEKHPHIGPMDYEASCCGEFSNGIDGRKLALV